jgi:hypothetical protein
VADTYFLRTGLLVIKVDVAQPPFRAPLLDLTSLKKRGLADGVTFENGLYRYSWTFGPGTADFVTPPFRCGEPSVTVTLTNTILSFKFKVKREVAIEIDVDLQNTSDHFFLTGKVSPRHPTLDLPLPGISETVALSFRFALKVSPQAPAPPLPPKAGLMFAPSEPQTDLPAPSKSDNLGIVGLSNLGTPSCLNCFLQILFHIPAFRRSVYSSASAAPAVCQLQFLFALMQSRGFACSARDLVRAIGGADAESLALFAAPPPFSAASSLTALPFQSYR